MLTDWPGGPGIPGSPCERLTSKYFSTGLTLKRAKSSGSLYLNKQKLSFENNTTFKYGREASLTSLILIRDRHRRKGIKKFGPQTNYSATWFLLQATDEEGKV